MKRIRVALNRPRRVNDFVAFAKSVVVRLTEDPLFSPPAAPLATLQGDIAALEAALVAVLTRRIGASAERRARQTAVLGGLQTLQTYVQTVADTRSPGEASMVAARAGMAVKNAKGPTRAALTVKPGRVSGTAHAYVRAAKTRAGYEWQVARDGADPVSLPVTMKADVALDGLEPGTLVSVRARAVTTEGPSDWLGPVRFRVT